MEYSFTDWDRREYERKTNKCVTVSSIPEKNEKISLSLSDGEYRFLKLNLTRKEAKAIALTLEAALGEIDSKIEI